MGTINMPLEKIRKISCFNYRKKYTEGKWGSQSDYQKVNKFLGVN